MKLQYIFSLLILALVLSLLPIVAGTKDKETVWNQTDFWFRDDDGTEISATGYGSPDTDKNTNITNLAPGTVFRLRFGIRVADADGTLVPRLEFKQGTDCAVDSWTVITPTSDVFNLYPSDNFNDGDATTQQITNGSFVAGQILKSTNPASSLDLVKNDYTEYEWSLQANSNITAGTTYSFRLTNNGTVFNNYDECPSLITQSGSGPGPSGVGGGRTTPTIITFSGRAFPNAKILVVDKTVHSETVISQNIVTDTYGAFYVNFVNVSQGLHSFGLLIKDKDNRTTQTKFFNIEVPAHDLIAKDILVPPTIELPQRMVSRGQPLIVIGSASPYNSIIIEIDDIIKKEANVEKDGSYKVAIDTGILEFGTHYVRVRQIDRSQANQQKRESDYSPTNAFVVSRLVLPKTDLSNDGLVDIKDWSIFLSNWVSEDESQRKIIDFNDDGKINISDFSIFIRAIKK